MSHSTIPHRSNTTHGFRRLSPMVSLLAVTGLVAACGTGNGNGDTDSDNWPTQPIDIIVGAGAGGNTDLNSRALADGLSGELDVPVNVTNMEGGNTGVALDHVQQQDADGYTLLGMAESIRIVCPLGYHDSVVGADADWIPLLSVEFPGLLSVPVDSPYEDMDDLIQAISENPGELQYAASDVGSVWSLLGNYLEYEGGLDIDPIAYGGSAPSQNAALSGEVDFVITGFGEQEPLIEGEELRPLAAMTSESYETDITDPIPSITEYVPELEEKLPFPGWQGLAIPSDTPDEVVDTLNEAYQTVVASDEYASFVDNLSGELVDANMEESNEIITEQTRNLTGDLVEYGLNEVDPAECGIDPA